MTKTKLDSVSDNIGYSFVYKVIIENKGLLLRQDVLFKESNLKNLID